MARKEVKESHHQTDVRYIRRHPKHDRFPVRRLGLAAILIAVAMILMVVLPLPWPISSKKSQAGASNAEKFGGRPVLAACCLVKLQRVRP